MPKSSKAPYYFAAYNKFLPFANGRIRVQKSAKKRGPFIRNPVDTGAASFLDPPCRYLRLKSGDQRASENRAAHLVWRFRLSNGRPVNLTTSKECAHRYVTEAMTGKD